MSTTSLMFHGFGVSGFQLQNTDYSNGEITFNLSQDKHNLRCSVCHSSKVKRRGKRYRKLRSVPIGNKSTFIAFNHQRVECKECNCVRYVKVNFVEKEKQHTRSFKNYALTLLRFSTVKHVANHLDVGWDLIKDIDKTDLKRFEKVVFKDFKQIAIDEIYLGKKGKFITIVLNIETGAIVYVGDGKGADSLDNFWSKVKRSKAIIEAVASDMSAAYAKAITENIPNAVHVTDHFHVIKLFNEKLTKLRRDLHNEVEDVVKKKH
jgi:transposase